MSIEEAGLKNLNWKKESSQ